MISVWVKKRKVNKKTKTAFRQQLEQGMPQPGCNNHVIISGKPAGKEGVALPLVYPSFTLGLPLVYPWGKATLTQG